MLLCEVAVFKSSVQRKAGALQTARGSQGVSTCSEEKLWDPHGSAACTGLGGSFLTHGARWLEAHLSLSPPPPGGPGEHPQLLEGGDTPQGSLGVSSK